MYTHQVGLSGLLNKGVGAAFYEHTDRSRVKEIKVLKETQEIIKSFKLNGGKLEESDHRKNKRESAAPPETEQLSKHKPVKSSLDMRRS